MKSHTGYPFQKARSGLPRTTFEKLGPFTLKVGNKGFYELYEIILIGNISILKQISMPGLYDACLALDRALAEGKITEEIYNHYGQQFK